MTEPGLRAECQIRATGPGRRYVLPDPLTCVNAVARSVAPALPVARATLPITGGIQ